jgi:hypothetical protein
MDLSLILPLIKVALDVFKDERKDRYIRRFNAIEKEFQDELNKGIDDRSDLKLDRLRFDARQLIELIVKDSGGK